MTVNALERKILRFCGAVAQLGERVNGIHEVVGSIPSGSTKFCPHRLVGLGHRPFTAATGVRIPLGTPFFGMASLLSNEVTLMPAVHFRDLADF